MITLVHKDRITSGDAIVAPDGKIRTVCQKDIQYNNLMGVTIFGDSYHAGHKLVPKVLLRSNYNERSIQNHPVL